MSSKGILHASLDTRRWIRNLPCPNIPEHTPFIKTLHKNSLNTILTELQCSSTLKYHKESHKNLLQLTSPILAALKLAKHDKETEHNSSYTCTQFIVKIIFAVSPTNEYQYMPNTFLKRDEFQRGEWCITSS